MMKKICFLVKNIFNQGGDTIATVLLANKMIQDNEVTIISLFKTSEKPLFNIDKNIRVISLFEEPFSLRKNYFKTLLELRKVINSIEMEVLLIGAVGFNSIVYPIVRNKRIKVISCEHASYYDGGKTFGMAWLGRKIACRYMDCIVVLTSKDLKDYQDNIKKINRIEQIYNPMDEALVTYPYNKSSKQFITCGRLVEVKGYDYLVEVAKKVFDKHPDWEWHIYGEGPERRSIKQKIEEYGLKENVKIMGEITNIYEKYHDYAAYVMTSRAESFGMVLVEALKSGIPAISFDCNNGPREIVRDGENGALVNAFDVEAMSTRMCNIIEDKELRVQLASQSQIGLDKFKIDNIYLEWMKLIESINN